MDVMYFKGKAVVVFLLVILQLTACGGGGGSAGGATGNTGEVVNTPDSENGTGNTNDSSPGAGGISTGGDDTALRSGRFVDSPVSGLTYVTLTTSGITDGVGTFNYHIDETVSFYIGDIFLGQATGAPVITPFDLVGGVAGESDVIVSNIARFLQSIDDDEDPSNGIDIIGAVSVAALGKSLDFTSTNFESLANALLLELTTGIYVPARSLVASESAQQHLDASLVQELAGIYLGDLAGDDTGTWRIVFGVDGTMTGTLLGASSERVVVSGNIASNGVFVGAGSGETATLNGVVTIDGVLTGTYQPTPVVTITLNGTREVPATVTDPVVTDPGTTTDPGAPTDPGTPTDPGSSTDPVPGTGSGPPADLIIPLGYLDIIGENSSIIGTKYEPEAGYRGVNAIQYQDVGGNSGFATVLLILNLTAEGDLILATFSWANGNGTVAANVVYTYAMLCIPDSSTGETTSDCSTVTVNPVDKTVTFTNSLFNIFYADAVSPITLNGTMSYRPLQ